ncbi:MAG: DsrE family protein [Ginsengibacter sp.]
MKKTTLFLLGLAFCFNTKTFSQQVDSNAHFNGAVATLNSYKALYVINQSDEKKIKGILRNINNALEDPRLKGKLQVELIAFGDGVEMFRKTNPYDTALLNLQKKGVLLAQCANTLKERKIGKDELWPFISYVPTGNGEIIIRHYHGWAIVHP